MQLNYSTIVITQSDDGDQTTNTEPWLERILLKFQYTTKENNMCKEELLELMETHRHECGTRRYLRLGMYVVAVWSSIQIGLNLCNFGKRLYSFHQA